MNILICRFIIHLIGGIDDDICVDILSFVVYIYFLELKNIANKLFKFKQMM